MLAAALLLRGPAKEQLFQLDAVAVCDIGRSPDNVLQIESPSVSRRHAIIHRGATGRLTLTDLGSQNGTWINGRRVNGTLALNNGDRIQIGDHSIEVRCSDARDAAGEEPADESTRLVVKSAPATVLVMDLHNYTSLSQTLESSVMPRLLSELGSRAGAIFTRHGAWSYKSIADAVMAVWVHETQPITPSHIAPPLEATAEIATSVEWLGSELRIPGGLRMGAGLSTGQVSFGGLGAQNELDVVGDTVNKAFRLEAATRPLNEDILVCEATRELMSCAPGDLFRTHQAELKGFAANVCAYGITFAALHAWLPRATHS